MSEEAQGQAQAKPDLMGYESVEALVQAKRASDAEVKNLAQRLENVEQMVVANQPRQAVPQRGGTAADRLRDYGVPDDILGEYIDERVNPALQKFFDPIIKAQAARTKLMAENPKYAEFEPRQAAYLQDSPAVAKTYNAIFKEDPEEALRYLGGRYADHERQQRKGGGQRQVREEMVHAQIPGARSGDSRYQPEGEMQMEEARRRLRETNNSPGAVQDFARLRLKQAITDDFLNQ